MACDGHKCKNETAAFNTKMSLVNKGLNKKIDRYQVSNSESYLMRGGGASQNALF